MTHSNTFREPPLKLFGAFTLALCCFGFDTDTPLTSRITERWGSQNGFPHGPVYAITQGQDGYLWIGTEQGLVRFDGQSFRLIQSSEAAKPVRPVLGLVADKNGNLWVRPRRPALLQYREGNFENPMSRLGRPGTTVAATASDRHGRLLAWMLKGEPSGVVLERERFQTVTAPVGFSRSPVLSLAQLPDGEIWVGTRDAGLFRLRGDESTAIPGLPDLKVNSLLTTPGGEIWIGTDKGLTRWNGRELTRAGIPPLLQETRILALASDRHSHIWVGTNSNGLIRLDPGGNAVVENAADNEAVTALFEDREGSIWVGRASHLERIRTAPFASLEQTRNIAVGAVYVDPAGGVWTAPAAGGLVWVKELARKQIALAGIDKDVVLSITGAGQDIWVGRQSGSLTHLRFNDKAIAASTTYTRDHGLPGNAVSVVRTGADGSVWAGTVGGGAFRFDKGRFSRYMQAEGLASNVVTSIARTVDGNMWFGTARGLSSWNGSSWHHLSSPDQLPSGNVNCLFTDSNGFLWVGTTAGLGLRKGNSARPLTTLLRDNILGIAEDKLGWLWIATTDRLLRVDRDRLAAESATPEDFREYGPSDGLAGPVAIRRQSLIVADLSGRIWLASRQGLLVFDPERLLHATPPAKVDIHTLLADEETLPTAPVIRIPPQRRRVRIGYAGLSLTSPDRMRFRYRLDGFDQRWSEPVAAREAVYTNLSPGAYTFRLVASNSDGVWNMNEATLRLDVQPAVWQTVWFRASVVLALAAAMTMVYRRRVRQLTHEMNVRFEERLAERTRIAQELHDTLLQGFLSASMQLHVAADQLPDSTSAKPQISRVLDLMRQVIDEGRNAVRGLRSTASESLDLEKALTVVQQELGRHDVEFRLVSIGDHRPIHPIMRDEVYRIGREAIVNAFNHSGGTSIDAAVEYSVRQLRLTVRDNGRGIDPAVLKNGRDGHWGLSGMRERADRIGARLHVWSGPGTGTEIELSVPSQLAFAPREQKSGWFSWLYPLRDGRHT